MLQIIQQPGREQWQALLKRPSMDQLALRAVVTGIIDSVKANGDVALKNFTLKFDKVNLDSFEVSPTEWEQADTINNDLKQAIQLAKQNIETFHRAQWVAEDVVSVMPGVECWRKSVGIEKVGIYIPGGTAPLFSTILMLAIPAHIAGCKQVVLCTPASADGSIHPAILFTAKLTGIHQVYKIGGAQAIAAMAYGTESIPAVNKIFGPGNQYVTSAKQLVQMDGVAIDMPAGPSEVAVLADDSADPVFVAADLLSQAEHGPDSQVLLVTNSINLAQSVQEELQLQLHDLPRKEIAAQSLQNSNAIVMESMDDAIDLVNDYAGEHLIINCDHAEEVAEKIVNAGSVFIGNYSPESAGDYASGTNHTLPTNGYAKAYSGVSVDSFLKKITYQKLSKQGLENIGRAVQLMAEAEGLQAHANAVAKRLDVRVENIM